MQDQIAHSPATLIGVLGASVAEADLYAAAVALGGGIAARGWWLVCGGLGGVMSAACRGAREAGGHTVGILPGSDRQDANPWVELAIASGMAEARNAVITRSAHACVAMPGAYGTLSEIAFCLKFGTPIVAFEPPGCGSVPYAEIEIVNTAEAACSWLEAHLPGAPTG
jgi:uncharacterized protein (TIGR00725 family)